MIRSYFRNSPVRSRHSPKCDRSQLPKVTLLCWHTTPKWRAVVCQVVFPLPYIAFSLLAH